jgi:hypothetical protein
MRTHSLGCGQKQQTMDGWRLRQQKRNAERVPRPSSSKSQPFPTTRHLEEIHNEYLRSVKIWREGLQKSSTKEEKENGKFF